MYQQKNITIRELLDNKFVDEKSERALRARADEGILVLIDLGEDGRTRLYDKQLSIVRANAIRMSKKKHPKITWGTFQRILQRLDKENPTLNETIIGLLNNGGPEKNITHNVEEIINKYLQEEGHLD